MVKTPLVNERYEPVKILAENDFYQAVLAKDTFLSIENEVLIKVFDSSSDKNVASLFELEERASQLLSNISGFFDYRQSQQDQEKLILVEKYIDLPVLSELIRSGHKFSMNEIMKLLKEIIISLRDINDRGFNCSEINSNAILYDTKAKHFWFLKSELNIFSEIQKESSIKKTLLLLYDLLTELIQEQVFETLNTIEAERENRKFIEIASVLNPKLANILANFLDQVYESYEEVLVDIQDSPKIETYRITPLKVVDVDSQLNVDTQSHQKNTIQTIGKLQKRLQDRRRRVNPHKSPLNPDPNPDSQKGSATIRFIDTLVSNVSNSSPKTKALFIFLPLLLFVILVTLYILSQSSKSEGRQQSQENNLFTEFQAKTSQISP